MPNRTTQIFISYASEDGPIATALETAFTSLAKDGSYKLDVVRDIHSFQQGLSITGQIHENLRNSDILFVIFTEQLKKSHSFTGYEVGAFSEIMNEDKVSDGKTDRLTVSLFLNEPPPTEPGILGIKLDVSALDRTLNAPGVGVLDSSGDLQKFLGTLSDLMIERQFRALNPEGISGPEQTRLITAKSSKREEIRQQIMPKLEADLSVALSSVIARNFIEQIFVQLRWEPSADAAQEICDNTILITDNPAVYELFGVRELHGKAKVTWKEFKEHLRGKDLQSAQDNARFTIDALQNAVSSAFSDGPIDNDQIFLASNKNIFRIIVSRYNVYFDGGRTMNVYLIPFLSIRDESAAERALILLRIVSNFRSDFLSRDAEFRLSQFDLYSHDFPGFRKLVLSAMRRLLLQVAASHNCGLDQPGNFRKFFGDGDGISSVEISQMYLKGESATDKILEVAAKFNSPIIDERVLMDEWRLSLKEYIEYAQDANQRLGQRCLIRLGKWFDTGELE